MLDNKTIVQREADSLTHYQILLYDFFFIVQFTCITSKYHFLSEQCKSFIIFSWQCCAVSFIEKLDAQALSITQEEFNRFEYHFFFQPLTAKSRQNVVHIRLLSLTDYLI